jgi:protein SCO1
LKRWIASFLFAALLAPPGLAHDDNQDGRLPVIGTAPDFTLTSQAGNPVSIRDLRGKVVAVTFIFASCTDTCPLLTEKMGQVQDSLGEHFGRDIAFVSITVDPQRDTPEVLKQYAESFGADPQGWYFLTGAADAIESVLQRYGVYAKQTTAGDFDHTFLTSLIDPQGNLRVQYLGYRFDPEEFRHDLLDLVDESRQD